MLRPSLNMRPVEDRRNPRINHAQGADQIANVNILWAVSGSQGIQYEGQVAGLALQGNINPNVAQNPFPQMPVSVNKTRHDDHVRGINRFGVTRFQVWADLGNFGI